MIEEFKSKEEPEEEMGPEKGEREELENLFTSAEQAEAMQQDLEKAEETVQEFQIKKIELQKQMEKFTGTEEVVDIKSSLPKDVLEKFNVSEILKHGRERFVEYLKGAGLQTLIAYIEVGGINLEEVEEIPEEWREKIKEEKQREEGFVMISPKLYLLSMGRCAELALKELLARIKAKSRPHRMK